MLSPCAVCPTPKHVKSRSETLRNGYAASEDCDNEMLEPNTSTKSTILTWTALRRYCKRRRKMGAGDHDVSNTMNTSVVEVY